MKKIILFFIALIVFSANIIIAEEPPYRFSLSPYVGYRFQKVVEDLDSGIELGLKGSLYFTKQIPLELGFGVIFPKSVLGNNYNIYRTLNLHLMYTFLTMDPLEFYGIAGIMTDFGKFVVDDKGVYIPIPSIGIGAGLRFKFIEDLGLRTELFSTNREIIAMVGFEKYFTPVAASEFNVKKVNLDLFISPVTNVFKERELEFVDTKGHWAEKDIKVVSRLGLIAEKAFIQEKGKKNTRFFMPGVPLTKSEVAKMLVMATKLHQFLEKKQTVIEYGITGNIGITYQVDLFITDKNKKEIKSFLKEQSIVQGAYNYQWDGKDNESNPLKEGKYDLNFKVMFKGKKIKETRATTSIVYVEKPDLEFKAEPIKIKDVNTKSENKIYIDESIDMGLFDLINYLEKNKKTKKGTEDNYFEPESNIKKLDMLIAIGKALSYLGLETKLIPDFTPYRDVDPNRISVADKKYLGLYITIFGYGIDSFGKIYPDRIVTRAEGSVLINRFLNWKKHQEHKKIPYFEQKLKKKLIKKIEGEEEKLVKYTLTEKSKVKPKKKVVKKKYPKIKVFKPLADSILRQMTVKGARNRDKPLTYRIVVGAFLTANKAGRYRGEMERISMDPYIWERKTGKKKKRKYSLFTVHLSSFDDRLTAKKYVKNLNAKNISAYIINQ